MRKLTNDMKIVVGQTQSVLANLTIQAGTRESEVAEAAGSVYKNVTSDV